MSLTPISSVARAVATARELCATSPVFRQRLVDHVDPDFADDKIRDPRSRVFLYQAETVELGQLMRDLRPMIVIGVADEVNWSALCPGCAVINLTYAGNIVCVMIDDVRFGDVAGVPGVPGPDMQGDAYIDALNFSGGVADSMTGRFGGNDDLIGFYSIQMTQPPMRPEIDERHNDDYFASILTFKYGDAE